MSYAFQSFDALANIQLASEQRRRDLASQAIELNNRLVTALETSDEDQVVGLLTELEDAIGAIESHDDNETKWCPSCGAILRPHSMNWFEGYHVDGCE